MLAGRGVDNTRPRSWSEVWRYGFLPAEFVAKILGFDDRNELPTGAIV